MKPRKTETKYYRIGRFKIRYQTLCIAAMVIILSVSSIGYIASDWASRADVDTQVVQVKVVIDFGDNSTPYSEIVTLGEERTAETAFRQVAELGTLLTQSGVMVNSVRVEEKYAQNNQKSVWTFYINGVISFAGLDRYTVRNGDILMLKFEEEPY